MTKSSIAQNIFLCCPRSPNFHRFISSSRCFFLQIVLFVCSCRIRTLVICFTFADLASLMFLFLPGQKGSHRWVFQFNKTKGTNIGMVICVFYVFVLVKRLFTHFTLRVHRRPNSRNLENSACKYPFNLKKLITYCNHVYCEQKWEKIIKFYDKGILLLNAKNKLRF